MAKKAGKTTSRPQDEIVQTFVKHASIKLLHRWLRGDRKDQLEELHRMLSLDEQ